MSILEGLATLIGSHLTREPTGRPVLTKWWKSELMLATSFGSLCPKVTNFGSQKFGYQIWFCTRLITVNDVSGHLLQALSWVWRSLRPVDIQASNLEGFRHWFDHLVTIKAFSQPFNSSTPSAAYIRQWIRSALVHIMACRLFSAKPLSKRMLGYCQLDP